MIGRAGRLTTAVSLAAQPDAEPEQWIPAPPHRSSVTIHQAARNLRHAAMSMTPVERRRLQARHEAMTALAVTGDTSAYSDANVAFHSAIYAGAHNAPVAEFALSLRRRVGPFRRAQFQVEGRLTRSNQEHATVVCAIVSGDAAGAHAAMLHHVGLVEDAFETFAATTAS